MATMFVGVSGHVLFEMACGYELPTLVPSKMDLDRVTDPALLDVLLLIFRLDCHGNFTSTLEQVNDVFLIYGCNLRLKVKCLP